MVQQPDFWWPDCLELLFAAIDSFQLLVNFLASDRFASGCSLSMWRLEYREAARSSQLQLEKVDTQRCSAAAPEGSPLGRKVIAPPHSQTPIPERVRERRRYLDCATLQFVAPSKRSGHSLRAREVSP